MKQLLNNVIVVIPTAFFALLGVGMHISRGQMDKSLQFAFLAFFITAVVVWFFEFRKPKTGSGRALVLLVFCISLLFSVLMIRNPNIIYKDNEGYLNIINYLAIVVLALLLMLFVLKRKALFWVLFFVIFVAKILVLKVSPNPYIDVFRSNSLAVDYLLSFNNPYSQTYPDIYSGLYDYMPGFLYWPGYLIWSVPFKLVFGDIRFGMVLADALSAIALLRISQKLNLNFEFSMFLVLSWMLFPIRYFVIEQAWIDPLLFCAFVWSICFYLEKRILLFGLTLGFLCSIKQYAVLIPWFLIPIIYRRSFGELKKVIVYCLCSVLVLFIFFLIWDFNGFLNMTVLNHWDANIRQDAYSMLPFLGRFIGLDLMQKISQFVVALSIFIPTLWLYMKKDIELKSVFACILTSFGISFFFGKFAFANYYDLLAGFTVVYIMFHAAAIKNMDRYAALLSHNKNNGSIKIAEYGG